MQPNEIMETILKREGVSPSDASRRIGRSRTYVATYIGCKRVPGLALMSELGDTLGYDLLLRRRSDGSEIVIDPPATE